MAFIQNISEERVTLSCHNNVYYERVFKLQDKTLSTQAFDSIAETLSSEGDGRLSRDRIETLCVCSFIKIKLYFVSNGSNFVL